MFLWRRPAWRIYWLVSNVWAIGQQYADQLHDRSAERPRRSGPPAERRVKRVGGGKTDAARASEQTDAYDRRTIDQPIVDFLNRFTAALGIARPSTSKRPPTARA